MTKGSNPHDVKIEKMFKMHIHLLTELSASNEIRGEVRSEAVGLSKRLKELDNSILLQVWNVVLERVYKTSVQLQKEGLPINVAVNMLQSLLEFIGSLRGRFDECEQSAIEMCGIPSYRDEEKRKRSRKRFFDEMDTSDSDMEDTISSPRDFLMKLNTELCTRMEAYISLSNRFGFLTHLPGLSRAR